MGPVTGPGMPILMSSARAAETANAAAIASRRRVSMGCHRSIMIIFDLQQWERAEEVLHAHQATRTYSRRGARGTAAPHPQGSSMRMIPAWRQGITALLRHRKRV